MTRKLVAYIGLIVLLALAAFGVLQSFDDSVSASAFRAASYFTVFGLAAYVLSFHLPQNKAAASISFLPFLTVALLVPSWQTVAMIMLCVTAGEALRRATPIKALFNVAQFCLSFSVALVVYRLLGGTPFDGKDLPVLAYVSLVTTYFLVNSIAVSGVVAISQGQKFAAIWRANTLHNAVYDLLAIPVVYGFAQLFLNVGVPGLLLLAVFILGSRQLYVTNTELLQANQELLQVMVTAIELRDPYTSGHSQRVAKYSKVIARAIGLSRKEVERVGVAALLHDVGKIDVRFADILNKPGRLTDEERRIIEEHAVRSAELVAMVSGLQDLVKPVRHHHERWDGGGYPDGLAGEAIPLISRIITFADTIDAMTSDRPYRKALGPAEVRSELIKHRGRQFDPVITDRLVDSDLFAELFAHLPNGGLPLPSDETVPVAPASVAGAPTAERPPVIAA